MGESFPEILSRLRRDKGVNQRTAAGALHISQALLSHYENGLREPGLTFVCNACDYYGVSADYLLGRSEVRTAFVSGSEAACGMLESLSGALSAFLPALEQEPALLEQAALCLSLYLYKLCALFSESEGGAASAHLLPALCDAALRIGELRLHGGAAQTRPDFTLPPAFSARMDAALADLAQAVQASPDARGAAQ